MSEVEHKVNHFITKSPALTDELYDLLRENGMSMRGLARAAHVSLTLVSGMLHWERPGKVSKNKGSLVIEAVAGNAQQAVKLFSLAGIDVYRFKGKGSRRLFKLV